MPRFRVQVQYPHTQWYEQTVEVEAATEDDAKVAAIKAADDRGWDDAVQAGDGECGESQVYAIACIDDTPSRETELLQALIKIEHELRQHGAAAALACERVARNAVLKAAGRRP